VTVEQLNQAFRVNKFKRMKLKRRKFQIIFDLFVRYYVFSLEIIWFYINKEHKLIIYILVYLTLKAINVLYIYIYIYIYGAPILDVSRSHTTTQHSR